MYKLSSENMHKENNTIQKILHNNEFDTSVTKSLHVNTKQEKEKTQWAKFTYVGRETRAITKAFKNSNMRITYSTNNTTHKLLTTRCQHTKCKYDECRIYQLTCPTWKKSISGRLEDPLRPVSKNISEISNTELVNPVLPNI